MMELLAGIPENIGWMINGALVVAVAYTLAKIVKFAMHVWREDEDEKNFEES